MRVSGGCFDGADGGGGGGSTFFRFPSSLPDSDTRTRTTQHVMILSFLIRGAAVAAAGAVSAAPDGRTALFLSPFRTCQCLRCSCSSACAICLSAVTCASSSLARSPFVRSFVLARCQIDEG